VIAESVESRGAGLACVVISFRGDARVVDAIRSLALQFPPPEELVVINSGGGELGATLRAARLDVPLIDRPDALTPGAARNEGIAATGAPFVAFLASDCLATPGWIGGRLEAHLAGARAVASSVVPSADATRIGRAAHLFLSHRRMPDTPAGYRRLYSMSYDRRLFERFGLFREDLRTGEDTEFNARIGGPREAVLGRGVHTAHRYPATFGAMLRDGYSRGLRRAEAETRLQGAVHKELVTGGLRNVSQAIRDARFVRDPAERRRLLAVSPLLVPAALSYIAGVIDHRIRQWAGGAVRRLRSW
jgi:glycosyltransferase involved in cell wall biosynthesis